MHLTPERWQHVARIYESAVDHDLSGRDAFLSEACGNDEALRREVESLLRQDASIAVLDRSVWATAASFFREDCDFAPGTELGAYRIEHPLGAGGMGEVFRATDTRLNRPVAIKVLPTGAALDQHMRARFAREARAVAALTHPHICILYDVGCHDEVDFLVMEYLEGDTLAVRLAAGRLSLNEALTSAIEIASALDHAHSHGIIHRDLKPANIMLTASGTKLLDFGVAKFRPASNLDWQGPDSTDAANPGPDTNIRSGQPDGNDAHVTRTGAVPGTVRYMAPEQIEGHPADPRSDLFSFGAVLFEMLTGQRAFDGDNPIAVRAAVLRHVPLPVSSVEPLVPPAMDAVVRRCLEKNPHERYQTAADLVRELKQILETFVLQARAQAPAIIAVPSARHVWRWIAGVLTVALCGFGAWAVLGGLQRWSTAPPFDQIRSVAVLPLENSSGDPEQEYFADGMTEELIADLATVSRLRVISRDSVMQYKETPKALSTIARELQVDAIIKGSIVRGNGRVRITATLIGSATGEVIWTQGFDRELRDVRALPHDVARTITSRADINTAAEHARLASARPVDPEVHRQVLLGRYHFAKGTEEGLKKAVEYFSSAIKKDPANAFAHAGLAEAYTELSGFYLDPREAMPNAKRAAQTALRLDDTLAEAHAALGYVHLVYDWDGPAAAKSLLRALDLNPTLATARLNYAAYLSTQARHDEAVQEVRRALDLDPLSIRTHTLGTILLLFTRRYDDAIELARKGLEFEPDSAFTLAFQGVAYAEKGRFEEAVDNLERAAGLDNSLTILALQAHVLAVAGLTDQARAVLRRVQDAAKHQYFCPYEIATVYVSLGDHDSANDLFRKGTEEHADCMAWLGVEPWLDPFRSDPRYRQLLRDIGLTPVAQ